MAIIGYLVFGVFFFGLVFLQNLIIETPSEKQLRAENKAIGSTQNVIDCINLQNQIINLADLKTKDFALSKII
jgi:hypothetical protein